MDTTEKESRESMKDEAFTNAWKTEKWIRQHSQTIRLCIIVLLFIICIGYGAYLIKNLEYVKHNACEVCYKTLAPAFTK